MMNRVKQKKKLSAVAVVRSNRMQGHLCYGKRKDDPIHKIIRFHEIQKVLEFARHDVCFCVGDRVIRRKGGWPMGSALSEPSTLIELQEDIRVMHTQDMQVKGLDRLIEGLSAIGILFPQLPSLANACAHIAFIKS